MRHPIAFLCLFFACFAGGHAQTQSQTQPRNLIPPPVPKPALNAPSSATGASPGKTIATVPATAKDLPVHQVILYKNGIGYFEHLGGVTGNQRVAIDFTSSQLNDVLQSLTVLDDNGGRIGGVNYNSTTPLAEQLKSLSLAMSDDPSSTELFQALRGQRVEVTGAPGGSITGRLMSIESRASAPSDYTDAKPSLDRYFLTLVAATGAVRVIELTPTLSVRPLDAGLQGQLDRYLELLSSTRSTGLRHLTLDALGQGQRQLRVSYISEVPVWKSTYRIVFPKDSENSAILQGWAVVDNTIGADWDNVQLSLVAGAPQSFIQELSQPLYLRRPEIPISTTAMTTPQTHEAAEASNTAAPQAVPRSMSMLSAKSANQSLGYNSNQQVIVSADSASISVSGYGAGSGGAIGGMYGRDNKDGVNRPSDALQEGDVSTSSFDDFFEYRLAQPVTIHKNESAMVPILQEKLPAERVTLWSASESTPFRAVWLTNSSKLTFDRGSFSIFESGVFAGQGLLDPIHPGEKRLLSYAVDQAIRVKQLPQSGKQEIRGIRITAHGFVMKRYAAESRTTYQAINSAEEPRVVVIEVPRRTNRKLSPESKAAEIAPTLYRFRIPVDSHKTASVLVADEGTEFQNWKIEEGADQVKALELLGEEIPAIADKLKPIIAAQREIAAMKNQLAELDQKSATLASDEARARENLTALKGNDAGKRFVEELNQAEDSLQSTRKQTSDLKEKEKAAVEALRQSLAGTNVEWSAAE
jgi:hypothetical protein